MAEWWYDNNTNAPKILRNITQIIQNVGPLNDAIANMTLAEAVQYIADKKTSGDPIAQLIIKYVSHYEDEQSDIETYNIGSVNQGGGGRSGGGGAGNVWDDYVDDDGPVSIFGNAKDTEEAVPYLTLISKGGVVSVAAQLFMPYSTAISALLPYIGLGITNNEFYNQNSNIVKDLVQNIIRFTYKSTGAIINAVADLVTGNVYVPKSFQERINLYFGRFIYGEVTQSVFLDIERFMPFSYTYNSESVIVVKHPDGKVSLTGRKYNRPLKMFSYYDEYPRASQPDVISRRRAICAASDEPITGYKVQYLRTNKTVEELLSDFRNGVNSETISITTPFSYDNKNVYYSQISVIELGEPVEYYSLPPSTNSYTSGASYETAHLAWVLLYGNSIQAPLPTGIESKPEKIPTWPYPPFVLTNPYTLNLDEYVPVNIPENSPWLTSTVDPEEPSTDEAIAPYLWPQVGQEEFYPYDPNEEPDLAYNPEDATAPLPDPNNHVVTTPVTDPSIPGGVIPSIDLPEFEPPKSGGTSPIIGVPDPLDWPSAVPGDTSGTHNGDPGLIHVYNPSNTEMQSFGRWLWVTYNDVTLNKIFNNPFDGVIGAHELYATPTSVGVKEKIRSGFLVSDVDAYPVLVRYTNINCGSIVIPEYWGNYLDYAPYTKVHVYLPFIGIVELEADDIIGHSVNINYAIDSYTGACIAQITVAKDDYVNTLYEFQGNCAVEVPITGGSQAAIKAGLITAAAYGISGLIGTVGNVVSGATGGAALGTGGAIAGGILGGLEGLGQTAANAINNVVSLKSSVQHSGTFGSSFGAMGIKKPYIIVKRPIQKVVANYNQDYGFPAHKQVVIGQCQGYLKVLEINVVSPTATNDEKAQIEALLKQGVYVS